MWESIKAYFSEFKVLKECTREFWILQGINFLDSLGYFTMITIITIFLSNNVGFSDVAAGTITGTFVMIVSASIFIIGPIVDQLGVRNSILIASAVLMLSRGGLAIIPTIYSWIDPKGYQIQQKKLREKQKKILESRKKGKKADPLAPLIEECKKKKAQKQKGTTTSVKRGAEQKSEKSAEKRSPLGKVKREKRPGTGEKSGKTLAKTSSKGKEKAKRLAKAGFFASLSIPQIIAILLIILMGLGTTMIVVAIPAGIRRFTDQRTRGTGFNFYYLIMNVAAAAAGFMIDALRDEKLVSQGNDRIFSFGFMMAVGSFTLAFLLSKAARQIGEESKEEREKKSFHLIAAEVVKEKAFWRFMLFILLLLGVRLTFTQMFMVMPKYYLRVLGPDAPIGFMNAINPIIIVIGLLLFIPILNKFDLFRMILLGTTISALSMFILAVPGSVFNGLGLTTIQGYKILIYSQIVIFAIDAVYSTKRGDQITSPIAKMTI